MNADALAPADIPRLFADNPAEACRAFVIFLTEHTRDCAADFDGDFSQMLVLGVVAQAHIGAGAAESWLTATRIGELTGIPRETVRRKLHALAARGWVQQDRRRGWRLLVAEGESALDAMVALTDGGAERLSKLLGSLARLS